MTIIFEYVKRHDGRFNVWRKGTGPWLLVHVCANEQEAIDFCESKNA